MADRRIFDTFRAAAIYAREFAKRSNQSAMVARDGHRWSVYASGAALTCAVDDNLSEAEAHGDNDWDSLEHYDAEYDELVSEALEAQDDFARSEEEGWYYDD